MDSDLQWILPEGAPADVALAEILVAGGLFDEPLDLFGDTERFSVS
jgi:hypothetical protein